MRMNLSCSSCGGNHLCLDEAVTDARLVWFQHCGRSPNALSELKEQVARIGDAVSTMARRNMIPVG